MPGPTNPYVYKPKDNPITVANQFGITPQQLIEANPGGYPFDTGQTINVPNTFQQMFKNLFTPPAPLPYLKPHGTYGQTISPTPYNNPVIGANGQPIGPHGSFGQVPNTTQPTIPEQVLGAGSQNYDVNMRGRGFGQGYNAKLPNSFNEQLKSEVDYALTSTEKPQTISVYALASLGIDPTANGYVFKNGQFVLDENAAQQQANQPQTDNNWQTNPSLYIVKHGQYAHNRNNRYTETLKHALTMQQHAKQRAKGARPGQQAQGTATGFGLVNFGASSG